MIFGSALLSPASSPADQPMIQTGGDEGEAMRAAIAMVILSGCAGAHFDEPTDGVGPVLTAELDRSDGVLDFGPVERGDVKHTELLLRNDGDSDLHLEEVVMPFSDRFWWANEGVPADALSPGEATVLLLAYAPEVDESLTEELIFVTNAGVLALDVRAEGLAPALSFEVDDVELDFVAAGQADLVEVNLVNVGRLGAEVTVSLEIQAGDPAALELMQPPAWVSGRSETAIRLFWSPPDTGEVWARLEVVDGEGASLSAGLHGVAY